MRKDEDVPAVCISVVSHSDHFNIYGDYSDQDVSEIIQVISEAQSRRSEKKTIEVRFYRVELDDRTLYREATIIK